MSLTKSEKSKKKDNGSDFKTEKNEEKFKSKTMAEGFNFRNNSPKIMITDEARRLS